MHANELILMLRVPIKTHLGFDLLTIVELENRSGISYLQTFEFYLSVDHSHVFKICYLLNPQLVTGYVGFTPYIINRIDQTYRSLLNA